MRFAAAFLAMIGSLFVWLIVNPTPAQAQSTLPPFSCDGSVYQVQSGQLRIFDPITSTYQNVGSNQGSYNGGGYNVLDNYLYASQGNNIIRIGANGAREVVFNIGFGSFSGDVDRSNNYWLRRNNNSYRRIDLDTGDVTIFNFTGPGTGVADVYFQPAVPNDFLIGFNGGNMVRYVLPTSGTQGTKEVISVPGLASGGAYGAAWTDSNGRVFTFNNNTGLLYEVFGADTNSPTAAVVAQGDPSGNNDGFSCALAPFPNLAPVAFDDDYVTPLNTAVTDNVVEDNGNGMDNDPDGGPITVTTTPLSGPSNGTVTLLPNGDFTYTPDTNFIGTDVFTYEITDDAGLTATATVTIVVEGTIDFDLSKTVSGPNPVTAEGQVLTYEVELVNTGDIPLTDVEAVDTGPGGTVQTLSGQVESGVSNGALDVGETWTYTYTYTVTQDDIDAGGPLDNAVVATTDETGGAQKTGDTSTPITRTPVFTLNKVVDTATLSAPGTLTYTITVVNTGNVTLTNPDLTDVLEQDSATLTLTTGPDLSGDTDGDGDLDVGETWVYTASFDATQAEIDDANDIVNEATFDTTEFGPLSDDATTVIDDQPSVIFEKDVDVTSLTAPGLLTYTITAENDGNVSLTGVSLDDVLANTGGGLTLTTAPMLSGDTDGDGEIDVDETFSWVATFAVTQAEIDDGTDIVNTATLSTNELADEIDDATTTITQNADFTLSKDVDSANLTAPGLLSYSIVLQNTGNVTLTGFSLDDVLTQGGAGATLSSGPTVTGDLDNDGELDVGETFLIAATFDVTQTEIDDGGDIVNTITIDPAEAPAQNDDATTTITQTDELVLEKAIGAGQPSNFSAVGDTVSFEFTISNPGNTTRTGPIVINDNQIGNGLVCLTGDLGPGEDFTCSFTWTAEQADLDDPTGIVTNIATAVDDNGFASNSDQQTVTATQDPQIAIEKTLDLPTPPPDFQPGEVLSYDFVITNPGNVTLQAPITVIDNRIGPITCPVPAGGLLPLEANEITCSATYTINANDVDLGSVVNVVTVTADFNGTPLEAQADALFPTDAIPVLELVKSTDPAGVTVDSTNDTITYTYTIANRRPPMGIGAALTQPITIDDDKLPAPFVCYDPATDGGPLLVDQTFTCTATYDVTQADLDAEEVVNVAVANTTFRPLSPDPVPLSSTPQTVTVPVIDDPSIALEKSVTGGPDPAAVGDEIFYEIIARNDGNQTLSNVIVDDPLISNLICDLAAPVTLAPDALLTCTGSYIVTLDDLDGQTVGDTDTAVLPNTASVEANDPQGEALDTVEAEAEHPLEPADPAVTITKSLFPDPTANPAYTDVGDVVRFVMTVENSGNVSLSSIDVTDSLVAGICTVGPLEPGDQDATCFFDYTITQGDIDAGDVTNTGFASAQPIDPNAPLETDDSELTIPGPNFEPELTVVKSGTLDLGADGIAGEGDLVTYQISVTNTGNVTITNTVVSDPLVGPVSYAPADDPDGDSDIDSLAPGDVATVTASYALTQIDVDAGVVQNSAAATGQDPSGTNVSDTSDSGNAADGAGPDDPTITPIPRVPAMTIEKSVSQDTEVAEGTVLTYTYVVANTGNVTLRDVTLDDQHSSASGTTGLLISPNAGVVTTLEPGDTATLTASYTVTQEDIDAGNDLTNVVSATSTSPPGTTPPEATDNETVDLEDAAPAIEALKSVASQSGSDAGDTVVFQITVANTGNVTLSAPALSDTLRRADNTLITPVPATVFDGVDDGEPGVIDVGEDWVYSLTYVLTQDDIDAGGISNTVTADATDPSGTPVSDISDNGTGDGDDPTVVSIPPMPSLETIKTITSSTIALDETVIFEITVENTGNVTLSEVAIASDTLTRADGTLLALTGPAFAAADAASPEGVLQVGETATYTASYVLTQDDIDAGGIANTATATGTPPLGAPVSDISDDDGAGDDPTVLDIPANPLFEFEKRLAAGSGPTFDAVDDVLDFEFEIINTGNVTLNPPYAITDALITDAGGAVTCSSDPIIPGASATCTGSYTIIQDDLDAGSVTNAATANVGDAPPVDDEITVPAVQDPALSLDKSAPEIDPIDFVTGLVVTYTFTSTNTGNVTLTDPIVIDDALLDPASIICPSFPADGLEPGGTYVCTADYTVTSEDVQLAVVNNVATAASGDTESPLASETIPNNGQPALTLTKTIIQSNEPDGTDSGGLSFNEAGDQLVYEFTVQNTGTVAFGREITVTDTLFAAPISCFTPTSADPELASGEAITCPATGAVYIVTQDDVDAGEVLNEAFARTEFGDIPTIVLSPQDDVTVLADVNPGVTIDKVVDAPTFEVGDVLTYDITLTNTGNQTLSNVVVDDPLLPGLVCEAAIFEVGDVLNCQGSYTAQQSDVNAGQITNTATATGIDPAGNAIPEQSDDAVSTGPTDAPTIALEKQASPDPFGPVGSGVSYVFAVTNTSPFTLSNVTVTDPIPGEAAPFTCVIASIDPGDTDSTCTLVATVTQADVDAGQIVNTAEVSGTDPFGNTATTSDTVIVAGPAQAPALEAVKTATVPATTVGTTVSFTTTVTNTGNVSLDPVALSDTMTRNDGTAISLTTPFVRAETTLPAVPGTGEGPTVQITGDTDNDGELDPGEVWVYTASYDITQADVNAGGFSNSVTATGFPPAGAPVSDISDDGNDADGNTTSDPTEVPITTEPVLDVEKVIVTATQTVGEEVVFEIRAANRGNVDLLAAVPSDALTRSDGTDLSGDITGPTRTPNANDNGDGTLDPGEIWTWEVRYTVTQDDIDAGGISNTATVDATDSAGAPVSDVSDNGIDGDGNTTNDPTELLFAPEPGIETTKVLSSIGTREGEAAVFTVTATNTGNVTLSDISFEDTMTNGDGTPVGPLDIGVSGLTDGDLPPGDIATWTVTYTLTQADIDSGLLENTATATGTTPGGLDLSDISDDGDDSDGDVLGDPTIAPIVQNPAAAATKEADIPVRLNGTLFEVTFTMTVENTGNVTLSNLEAADDLSVFVAPATLVGVDTPVVSGFDTGVANPGYNGLGDIQLLQPGAELAPDGTGTIELTVRYDTASGFPANDNTLSVTSDVLAAAVSASAPVISGNDPDIFASKSASPRNAQLGQTITYSLRFENRLATAEAGVTFVDILPEGIIFTPDTAQLDGVATAPAATGNTLTFGPVDMAPGQVISITYNARLVGGEPGEYVNTAFAVGADGLQASNTATATVTRRAEAVFDCSDIIGKVWDDKNGNGYQDPLEENRGVSNQAFSEGKGRVADFDEDVPMAEPGLPHVRLSTPSGTLITTDEYGRFSVPCAALPSDIGSNFMLKLDTRTLPSGYYVTTENPRVVRVTPGRLTKLNFGAALGQLVELDLMASAFDARSNQPVPALSDYVTQLLRQIANEPSVLRLTYYRAAESQRAADARLDALEKIIRDRWRGTARNKLRIERLQYRTQ